MMFLIIRLKEEPTYTQRATQRHTSDKSLRHIGGEAMYAMVIDD